MVTVKTTVLLLRRNVKFGDCISDLEINMGYDQYAPNTARKSLKSL